jgi:uncharacterized membrane protein
VSTPRRGATTPTSTELNNIHAIVQLERETLEDRSALDRLTDKVSNLASSGRFILIHLIWFALWIGLNSTRRAQFDPFPYSLLTLVVSLEAIMLTACVLMAQKRLTQQANKRAHLDLQVNLLAEQELTAILRMLSLLGEHAGIDMAKCEPRVDQLRRQTDVRTLAAALDNERAGLGTTGLNSKRTDDLG